MRGLDGKVKVAVALSAVLSWPVLRGWSDGTIPTNTAILRVAIAMVLAYGGVVVVTTVVRGYLPEEEQPAPESAGDDGVEDAVLVEPDETPTLPEDADADS